MTLDMVDNTKGGGIRVKRRRGRVLGRVWVERRCLANEVNLFLKQATTDSYMEIELKGPKGKGNFIRHRLLRADSKTSMFMLNGVGATGKGCPDRTNRSLPPQDKVSEFAAMNPQQLLRETQSAAGDRNLESWHQTLIEDGAEFKKFLKAQEQLKRMHDRNEAIERDVQRYKERKKIEEGIKLLAVLTPVQQYRELRDKYFNLKILQRWRESCEETPWTRLSSSPTTSALVVMESALFVVFLPQMSSSTCVQRAGFYRDRKHRYARYHLGKHCGKVYQRNGLRIETVFEATNRSVSDITYTDNDVQASDFGVIIEQDYENGSPTGVLTNGIEIMNVIYSGKNSVRMTEDNGAQWAPQ
ncbi:hypothetical protein BDZ89DRAFT_1256713 [Hymenopellis radicata]|nr:hypothetical protein BDZ89DRAFT_1256713 [Hymenopellis radicata]